MDTTIGGAHTTDTEAGIFESSNQSDTVYIPASRGECTEYCGRIFSVQRNSRLNTGSPWDSTYDLSTGCGTYETIDGDRWSSICAPYSEFLYDGVHGSGADFRESACADWDLQCPLGWGNKRGPSLYYEPGCLYGSHYPNPSKSSTSLSTVIGSPILTTVII